MRLPIVRRLFCSSMLLAIFVSPYVLAPASARETVQGRIVEQHLDAGQGITVLHVWGSHYDMGYAHGVLLADWIELSYLQMTGAFGFYWPQVRARVAGWTVMPPEAGLEYQGILDGVRAIHPETTMDLIDLKACSMFGDWSYSACRSTSCWGPWVEPPFTTLAARKLQFGTLPTEITQQWHHVVCAWSPDDGAPAWVNFGFPGYACSVTGLNEFGTLASLHDWNSSSGTTAPAALPRTLACRWILTMDLGPDPLEHLATAFDALAPYSAATGGFINYFIPDGGAGVIKSSKNLGFYAVRLPQAAYMNGESISTNNSDIDGSTGIAPWQAYYATLAPPEIRATMEGLWSTAYQATDLHIVEVGIAAPRDMEIWFAGRLQAGMLERLEWSWAELFTDPAAVEDPLSPPRIVPLPHPNPAVEGVTVSFARAESGRPDVPLLEIYDPAGRLVRTLTPQVYGTDGRHLDFHWDGRDRQGRPAATGAYLCRLRGERETERIIWIAR